MLRLACVLLYQGRFKSHRSRGSRISLRVRSILVTFCIYFCNSYIILVLCAILCSFSILFHFQFSSVCILAICLCMHVCLCAVYRTALSIANMWRYKNLRASIFCFAVCNYKFSNLAHTYWHVQSRFLHVALVLVVVLLLETLVLVVLVFVLVLMVVLGWS